MIAGPRGVVSLNVPRRSCSGAVSPGSLTVARGMNETPSVKDRARAVAVAVASRVFPTPPGPVIVTSRTPGRRSSSPSNTTSSSRPIMGSAGVGTGEGVRKSESPSIRSEAASCSLPCRSGWPRSWGDGVLSPRRPLSKSRRSASEIRKCPPALIAERSPRSMARRMVRSWTPSRSAASVAVSIDDSPGWCPVSGVRPVPRSLMATEGSPQWTPETRCEPTC